MNNSLARDTVWRYSEYVDTDEVISGKKNEKQGDDKTEKTVKNDETVNSSEKQAIMNLFSDMSMDSKMAKQLIKEMKQKRQVMIDGERDSYDGDDRDDIDVMMKNADIGFGSTIFGS